MAVITTSVQIAAPVDIVFGVFSDLEAVPGRIEGIKKLEKLTEGPVGVGTRFRETRIVFKREATETMEFTAFAPNQGYTVECDSCGAHYKADYRFEPKGDGTLVTLDFGVTATSFFAKLMKPLTYLMMGTLKKCFQKDMEDLKAAAEGLARAESKQ